MHLAGCPLGHITCPNGMPLFSEEGQSVSKSNNLPYHSRTSTVLSSNFMSYQTEASLNKGYIGSRIQPSGWCSLQLTQSSSGTSSRWPMSPARDRCL
ncbi:hypothetical protein FOQG_19408 [Fusarium oxysporum f. sp. raphani 54005]|uniref:Uncharacterized protein n=1 Tax=Fusarium oxysporum f. sp. raphani 54005 TaxID=1089458 RepID=X0BAI1_FUSOX|nr:hypothetical protein FOQG_19408 [Fusarium oxysporum f. sp. raphani 54005]